MPGMILNDVAVHAKSMLREPTSDTISVGTMESYVVQAYFHWLQEMNWPEVTFANTTADNNADGVVDQEYPLPDNMGVIFRVYVNGQRMWPTTIPLLEGDAVGRYDASWRVIPAVAIPPLSATSLQAIPITAGPSIIGKFMYYTRGGYVGFVPAPVAAGYPISIEAAGFPSTPASGDTLALPLQFKDGLAYGAIYRFLMGDRRAEEAKGYRELEQEQWQMAMRWRRRLASAGSDNLPVATPHGYRLWYDRTQRGMG